MDFIETLSKSGWVSCPSISNALLEHGLPIPDQDYLSAAFDESAWDEAEVACERLREHFSGERYSDAAVYGALLVPNPERFDVRAALSSKVRESQPELRCLTSLTNICLPEQIILAQARIGHCSQRLSLKQVLQWVVIMTSQKRIRAYI